MAPPCLLGEVGLDIDRCITLYLTIALTPTLLTPNSSLVKDTTKISWNNNPALDQYFMEIQSPRTIFHRILVLQTLIPVTYLLTL